MPPSRLRADDFGAGRNPELATSLQPVKQPHGEREDDKRDQHDEAERAHQMTEHGAECVSEEIAEGDETPRPETGGETIQDEKALTMNRAQAHREGGDISEAIDEE